MLQSTFIPQNTTIEIQLPEHYVGKKVHTLIYMEDEITLPILPKTSQKPSDFFGTLSAEEGANLHAYIHESRKEWSRDI